MHDHLGNSVRLTDERLTHILEHPEMRGLELAIAETLARPEYVVQSLSDEEARLYYRFYPETQVGGKLLCVVVKSFRDEPFVLTAYLTDKLKRGKIVWTGKS